MMPAGAQEDERFNAMRLSRLSLTNTTYPGSLWSFPHTGKGDRCPVRDLTAGRIEASGLGLRHQSAAVHRAAFALPVFRSRALDAAPRADRARPRTRPSRVVRPSHGAGVESERNFAES